MSSRSIQIIGGSERQHAWVDAATNALLVKVVNSSGGGGGGGDVNLSEYGGVPVGAGNALHVQPGTGAVFAVSDNGGSLTIDGTVTAAQATHDSLNANANLQIGDTDVGAANPVPVSDNGGSLTIDGTVGVSGTVAVTQSGAWTVGVNNFPSVQPVNDNGGSLTVDGTVAATQSGAWTVGINNFPTVQPVDDNGGSLTVDGTVAATQSGSWTVTATDGGGSLTIDGTVAATQSGAWTVGVNNFPAVQPVSDNSGSLTVDGTVAATQSGSWTSTVTQGTASNLNATVRVSDSTTGTLMRVVEDTEVSAGGATTGNTPMAEYPSGAVSLTGGTWSHLYLTQEGELLVSVSSATIASVTPGTSALNLGKAEDAVHGSGDVGVMALAVRQDSLAALAGTTGDYIPLTTDSLGRLRVSPGSAATDFGKLEDAAHASGDVGVMALAVRQDTATALAGTNGDYIPLITDASGRLWTSVGAVVPGTAATNLGKAEDAAHANGDTGVMMLAVRQDTLAALAGATGDYIPLTTDSLGRLNVREAGVATVVFSGSTRGRPIQITGTSSGTANTIHTATTTTGQLDRMFLWLTNTSTSAVIVTIEFGTTGTGNEVQVTVPAKETIQVLDGATIGGAATDTVKAYAATGSVINAFGRVERLS